MEELDERRRWIVSKLSISVPDEEKTSLLFIHPSLDCTADQVTKLRTRPHQYRLFLTTSVFGVSEREGGFFLRNHFSDDAEHESTYGSIRDFVWGDAQDDAKETATSSLANTVTAFMRMDEGKYYSVASILASALSEQASNTIFQSHEKRGFCGNGDINDFEYPRKRFVLLMEIIFSSVAKDRFLLRDENVNIYRIAFCLLHSGESNRRIWFPALLSVFLQMTLMGYVCAEIAHTDEWKFYLDHLPLAMCAALYAVIQAWKGSSSTMIVKRTLYCKLSLLFIIDAVVNLIIPVLAVIIGFILISTKEGYIDGVLNTAALLFISEIDDQLPKFLALSNEDIIRTYIVQNAGKEYDQLRENGKHDRVREVVNKALGFKAQPQQGNIEYSDIMVTNSKATGLDPEENNFFGPIDLDSFATLEIIQHGCLLKEVSWIYQYSCDLKPRRAKTGKGKVVYLKLVPLEGGPPQEILNETFIPDKNKLPDQIHTIQGVYMLTTFAKTRNSVVNLRICGSSSGKQFKKAMEYYSLWAMSRKTSNLLDSPEFNVESRKSTEHTPADDEEVGIGAGSYSENS